MLNTLQEKGSSNNNIISHDSRSSGAGNSNQNNNNNSSLLQEGNDIYLTCQMEANPRPLKPILWRFNGKPLQLSSMAASLTAISGSASSSSSVTLQANNNNNNILQPVGTASGGSGGAHNQLMIMSNQSLVLRKVSRKQSGLYTCEASNQHGSNTSKPLALVIRHAPVCATDDM